MDMERLEKQLGYCFRKKNFLYQALTHKSYGHEYHHQKPIAERDNERMEFLGDAVLDLVVSDLLLEAFPEAPEGALSKMRAAVVNEKTLARIAISLGVADFIRLGKGESQSRGREKPSILSSTFEALVAAVYLDGGPGAAFSVFRSIFASLFFEAETEMVFKDHKTELQEMTQARYKQMPTYHLVAVEGPDHARRYEIEVRLEGKRLAIAQGTSKKEAEQNAAKGAMSAVNGVPA
jgi:ribonuclease III